MQLPRHWADLPPRQFSTKDLKTVGNYTLGKLVGKGSFGKVYLARHNLTNGSKVCSIPAGEKRARLRNKNIGRAQGLEQRGFQSRKRDPPPSTIHSPPYCAPVRSYNNRITGVAGFGILSWYESARLFAMGIMTKETNPTRRRTIQLPLQKWSTPCRNCTKDLHPTRRRGCVYPQQILCSPRSEIGERSSRQA